MADKSCADCTFRAKYDDNPKSILGRLWHWHAGWCPGWKAYMNEQTPEARRELAEKYQIKKYLVS